MKSDKLSIIVYSCLRNSDMWIIFSSLFKKYWGDCDYKLILLTDRYKQADGCEYVFDDVICVDSDWSTMIKTAISHAATPYVMLFMDDYLLSDNVRNIDIERVLSTAIKEHSANIRLSDSSMIKPKFYEDNPDCAVYPAGSAYSFSTQVGIWDSSFLMKEIKDGWSAWDFERIGSMECIQNEQPLLLYKKYSFPYVEGVRNGKWLPEGISICKQNGLSIDYSKKKKLSIYEMIIIYVKALLIRVNPDLVQKIQNYLLNFFARR